MSSALDHCSGLTPVDLAEGTLLIREGERTGCLFILAEGALEVFREDVQISVSSEPGAVFGEMSILLDKPHTASVRTLTAAKLYRIEDAAAFLKANPTILVPVATLLAHRLQNATNYLVNLKQQFRGYDNHFAMVDEVLESLTHQQTVPFTPAEDLPREP